MNDLPDIRDEGGHVVIGPFAQINTIFQLLAAIALENLHTEVDFGAPAGKELL